MTNFGMMVSSLKQNIARAVVGKDDVVELMLTALLCEGHVLIEDVPGVGKTTLASALARSLSCSFKRIQFTPDITPSDITGFTMPSLSGEMQYHPGAIMSQIVLADEINRTSPKTQSALLEVMEERQVTVDGVTYPLARPFMVLSCLASSSTTSYSSRNARTTSARRTLLPVSRSSDDAVLAISPSNAF